jgi:hypothetical protein
MAHLLATYALEGDLHRIELVALRDGAIVLDRATEGDALVVAELARGEGEDQALAVIHAGRYLERARAGETGLGCAISAGGDALGSTPSARAA